MLNATRQYDSVGRYGGEEFLLIFPGCNAQATLEKAEWLRSNLCTEPLLLTEKAIILTASFGATSVIPRIDSNSEGLIRTADEALYRAKRLGRNRVEYLAERTGQPAQTFTFAAQRAVLEILTD